MGGRADRGSHPDFVFTRRAMPGAGRPSPIPLSGASHGGVSYRAVLSTRPPHGVPAFLTTDPEANIMRSCRSFRSLRGTLLLFAALVLACGDDRGGHDGPAGGADGGRGGPDGGRVGPDGGRVEPDGGRMPPGGSGRIAGTVLAPNGDGLDVVPGARLAVAGGPSTVADGFGRFVLEDVPAGEAVVLRVEGPATGTGERFGTTELRVGVEPDRTALATPYLLRACRALVDASTGGAAAVDRCAGAGGVSVTFPASAFATADGRPFDGRVRVEMTAVAPDGPGDVAGLPPDGLGAAGPPIWGGAEVRLFDADGGEPLALAEGVEATLRFELPALPDDVDADDLVLEWYDPDAGAWTDAGGGAVVAEGERRFFEATVTHFTTYRASTGPRGARETCLLVVPRVCPPGGACAPVCPESAGCADEETVRVQITDLTGRRPPRVVPLRPDGLTGRACIRVAENRVHDVVFFYVDPATGASGATRRRVRSGACDEPANVVNGCEPGVASSCTPQACTNLCDHTDRGGACAVDVHPRRYGCASGTFLTASREPVWGPVHVFAGGDRIATFELPRPGTCDGGSADCRGNFCVEVPLELAENDTELVLMDSVGNRASFVPSAADTAEGNMCPRTRSLPCGICDMTTGPGGGAVPVAGCQPIDGDPGEPGRQPLVGVCTNEPLHGRCLHAGFTYSVAENTGTCPPVGEPDKRFEVTLDASPSTGDIAYFEWFVDGALVARRDAAERRHTVCLADGRHRVRLEAVPVGRSFVAVLRAHEERTIVLERLPCASSGDQVPPRPDYALSCVYDYAGLAPSRDCTRGDGSRALFVYADAPCGFPCLTMQPLDIVNLWAFDPLPFAVAEQLVSSAAEPNRFARVEYTLDDDGNVRSRTEYDIMGAVVRTLTYTYDALPRPTLVEVGDGAAVVETHTLTWDGDRLATYARESTVGFVRQARFAYRYDQGRLASIDWLELNGNARGDVFVFAYGADTTTIEHRDANGMPRARLTYDYVCD